MDPSNLDKRRKRLWFRSHHMGMHENDIIVGTFVDAHIERLSEDEVDRLEALVEQNDIDLLNWIIGRSEPPEEFDNDMLKLLQEHKLSL
ncbi:MAG: succinate dehydrogenase assembly factor 2 [Rhodospirillales bacterium]|nr:succinate dehydrogenase assembly factor 2 [Rhodospirillales bacterium]